MPIRLLHLRGIIYYKSRFCGRLLFKSAHLADKRASHRPRQQPCSQLTSAGGFQVLRGEGAVREHPLQLQPGAAAL